MPSVTLITYLYVAGWPRSLGSHEVTTQRVSPVILKIMGANILVSRHRPARVTWPFDSPGAISDRCSIVTESLSPTIFEIFGRQYPCARTPTHTQKHAASDFIFCPMQCIAFADNNVVRRLTLTFFCLSNAIHCLNHLLPVSRPLDTLRPRGHNYALPACYSMLHKKSFIVNCFYRFV